MWLEGQKGQSKERGSGSGRDCGRRPGPDPTGPHRFYSDYNEQPLESFKGGSDMFRSIFLKDSLWLH